MSHHSVFKKKLWTLKFLLPFLLPDQHNSAATYCKESWRKFCVDCSEALAKIKLSYTVVTKKHSRMIRKMRQRRATSFVTVYTSICVSLALTWLVIILKSGYNSCVNTWLDVLLRPRKDLVLHCYCSGHGRCRKSGPKGWPSWTEGMLYGCVTVIAIRVKSFKAENSKL